MGSDGGGLREKANTAILAEVLAHSAWTTLPSWKRFFWVHFLRTCLFFVSLAFNEPELRKSSLIFQYGLDVYFATQHVLKLVMCWRSFFIVVVDDLAEPQTKVLTRCSRRRKITLIYFDSSPRPSATISKKLFAPNTTNRLVSSFSSR